MIVLREWETIYPRDGSSTIGVHVDDTAQSLLGRLSESKRLVVRDLRDGLEIEARSWVGRVRLGSVEIAVVPKLAADTLLALFRYAYGLADVELHSEVVLDDGSLSIADLVIAQLQKEADALIARGLHRRYLRREEVLAAPRGKIIVSALARGPLVSASPSCEHHPRDVEWSVNRIVRAGLELAATLSGSNALSRSVASSVRDWSARVRRLRSTRAVSVPRARLSIA
ncbi:MAG: hypothetical protein IT379_04200 [Deltaproteobacteria bacterium]|nr:hypothetical protein [Deltaproteobacteria bacterium]